MRSFVVIPLLLFGLVSAVQPVRAQDAWEVDVAAAMERGEWERAVDRLDDVLAADPDLLHARLKRAVANRERAVVKFDHLRNLYFLAASSLKHTWEAAQLAARGENWELDQGRDYEVTQAIFDFEYILARDSSYFGALHEYARLWHRHHVFDRAIALAEAQIRIEPALGFAHAELVEIYRHFIARSDADDALQALRERGTAYAAYFIGEVHRREGRFEQADSVFAALLDGPNEIPAQPVLLSRARLLVAQGRYEEAHAQIEEAVQVWTPLEGRMLLSDFKYVMTEDEYAEAQRLGSAGAYADFYARMWARRDPAPASDVNWRLVEHMRRLVVAERDFEYYGPRRASRGVDEDRQFGGADLSVPVGRDDFPSFYAAAHGFNDKGLIFIRHGEPDEIVETQPQPGFLPGSGVPMNASWRYLEEGLDFHFMISQHDGIAYSWPLVSVMTNCNLADDRKHWGGLYNQLAPSAQAVDPRGTGRISDACGPGARPRDELELLQTAARLGERNRAIIAEGLTSDRHTWSTQEVEAFDFPYDVVTFRGYDGATDVSAYLALPVGWLSESADGDTLPVEIGIALHDQAWRAAAEESVIRRFAATEDRTAAAFDAFHASVPPDSYRVSLHADLQGAPPLGGYQFERRIPDYSRPETMMSDVLVAYDIRPKPGHAATARSSLDIVANPFRRVSVDQPLHVYFELYNLVLDGDDRARYRVEYRLEPQDEEGGILGLFRRTPPGLSVAADFEDETPSPIVFSQIDLSELPSGSYELVVRVSDRNGDAQLERRLSIELLDQGI